MKFNFPWDLSDTDDDEGKWVTPSREKQCGNCHKFLSEGDVYCRFCGTKKGEGEYKPYLNVMVCIYGPMPLDRLHKCESCGHEWTTCDMVDDEKFCPKCGGNAPVIRCEEEF